MPTGPGRPISPITRLFGRPLDEREPVVITSAVERRYAVREVRARLHQARFRGLVLPAYGDRCTICGLKETRLLDAAHIIGDPEREGAATVTNGLSLCSIHHRAYDENLVGVSPDYEVRVSRRLLEEDDGPMLDVLKTFDRHQTNSPRAGLTVPTVSVSQRGSNALSDAWP
jgi:putative restriction endonuclease